MKNIFALLCIVAVTTAVDPVGDGPVQGELGDHEGLNVGDLIKLLTEEILGLKKLPVDTPIEDVIDPESVVPDTVDPAAVVPDDVDPTAVVPDDVDPEAAVPPTPAV